MKPMGKLRPWLLMLAVLIGLLWCGVTQAAEVGTQVATMVEKIFQPLSNFQAALAPSGARMVGALVLIHIVVGAIMYGTGTLDLWDLIFKGMKLCFVGGLALAAVVPQSWLGTMTGLGGAVTLPQAIMSGMQGLMMQAGAAGGNPWFSAQMATGGQGAGSGGMFTSIIAGGMGALEKFFALPVLTPTNGTGSVLEWMTGNLVETVASIPRLFAWLATILIFCLAFAAMLIELIGSDLTIRFALAFTPLMVPWILVPSMSFLFDSWLKMLIVGSLGFVVGLLLMSGFASFASEAANQINTAMQASNAATLGMTNSVWLYSPVILGCLVFLLMASKVTQIASSLVSGTGTSGFSFKEIGRTLGATSAVAGAPGQVAGGAVNAANSVRGGLAAGAAAGKGVGAAIASGNGTLAAGGTIMQAAASGAAAMAGSTRATTGAFATPGARAAAGVASKAGVMPNGPHMNAAIRASDSAYAASRANGASASDSLAKANQAATAALQSAPRAPRATPPVAAPSSPPASPTSTP